MPKQPTIVTRLDDRLQNGDQFASVQNFNNLYNFEDTNESYLHLNFRARLCFDSPFWEIKFPLMFCHCNEFALSPMYNLEGLVGMSGRIGEWWCLGTNKAVELSDQN